MIFLFLQCVSPVIIVYIIISQLNSYLYIHWILDFKYILLLLPPEVRSGPKGTSFTIHTIMGRALNGTSAPLIAGRRVTSNFMSSTVLENKINRLWEIEEEGILNNPVEPSIEDRKVSDLWDAKYKIVDQQFHLPIPWKAPEEHIPDNIKVARNGVDRVYRSLKGKYLPTPAVLKSGKHSLRIVFDCDSHTLA